jgi:hypothetical protein
MTTQWVSIRVSGPIVRFAVPGTSEKAFSSSSVSYFSKKIGDSPALPSSPKCPLASFPQLELESYVERSSNQDIKFNPYTNMNRNVTLTSKSTGIKGSKLNMMILALIMSFSSIISAQTNPHLPSLKERQQILEQLDEDIQVSKHLIDQYQTAEDIQSNMSAITNAASDITFYRSLESFFQKNISGTVEDVLLDIHSHISAEKIAEQKGNELNLSETDYARFKSSFDEGNWVSELEPYIHYVKR